MKRRGVSPLIATVLLIGATIAIAAIVSTFIIQQTKKFEPEKMMGESTFCQDVVLGLKFPDGAPDCQEVADMPDGCKVIGNPILVNKGSFGITKLAVGADKLSSGELRLSEDRLGPGKKLCGGGSADACIDQDIIYDDCGPGGRACFKIPVCDEGKTRIVPYITVEEETIACTQSEMVINYENVCA